MDHSPEVIAGLSARLEALEQRVFQLEHPLEASPVAPLAAQRALAIEAPSDSTPSSSAGAGGTFPVLGKAVLGMAGAYLLRALAEAGTFPKLAVIVLAIAYAGMWLVGAARVGAARTFAGFAYALTSALILAPMLWELTVRFNVLTPSVTAGALAGFAIAALALTWRRAVAPVFWVGYTTSILAALVLMIATQELAPFLCALFVIALASEAAACAGHALNGRVPAAVAADIAVASLLYIYSMPEGTRAGFGSLGELLLIALASVPFFLYFASITLQGIVRGRRITLFEMLQIVLAFLFASYGSLTFGAGQQRTAVGIACVLLCAVGYAIAFAGFRNETAARNFRAYTTGSAALLVLGCTLSLPSLALAVALGAAAVVATTVGARTLQPALEFQAAAYLIAAAGFSGLLMFDQSLLIGSQPFGASWIDGILLACALACYAVGVRPATPEWRAWVPNLVAATVAAMTGAAFVMLLFVLVVERVPALRDAAAGGLLGFLQTLTLCAVALLLAAGGSRRRRQELIWLAYATLALAAGKILLEDVRHGHLLAIAASFVLYAAALILLPRLAGHHREVPALTRIEP